MSSLFCSGGCGGAVRKRRSASDRILEELETKDSGDTGAVKQQKDNYVSVTLIINLKLSFQLGFCYALFLLNMKIIAKA